MTTSTATTTPAPLPALRGWRCIYCGWRTTSYYAAGHAEIDGCPRCRRDATIECDRTPVLTSTAGG